MKKTVLSIALGILLLLPAHVTAQTIDLQILDSLTNAPIENVYVYDSEKEFLSVTDKNGACKIELSGRTSLAKLKQVTISHIGYTGKTIKTIPSRSNIPGKILLKPTTYVLQDVTVSLPNAKNIIEKAIESIPENYPILQKDTIALDLNFIFFNNPNSKIAEYKGKIALHSNGKYLLGAKYAIEKNHINSSFHNYGNEISPSGFYSIIFIQNHAPIRLSKKMNFHYDGMLTDHACEGYKISFKGRSKYNNMNGYMLINKNDYAITHITYEIGAIKKWIAATQKPDGLVYTNLKKYKVSVSFKEGDNGYTLSEGSINMLFNRTKKETILSNNSYDVTVKNQRKWLATKTV
jgi:hypothetical protein